MIVTTILALAGMLGMSCGVSVTWCTTGAPEQKKCLDISNDYKKAGSALVISCEKNKENDDDGCLNKVASSADVYYIRSLDAGFIYKAIQYKLNVKVVLAEDYGLTNGKGTVEVGSYYAVAVVKSGGNIDLRHLKNLKTCHTGYEKTSGWNMPLGYLAGTKQIDLNDRCNDAVNKLSDFVQSSCVPDATSKVKDDSNLCSLCTSGKCSTETTYAGYTGAFRCLVEGGDVAFVKHTTVSSNTDGQNTEAWATSLRSADYRLLCKDGTQVTVDNYRTCNFALVPAHGLIVHGDMPESDVQVLQRELRNPPPKVDYMFKSKPYTSGTKGKDLLFKDSTTELAGVFGIKQTPKGYLDTGYLEDMNNLHCAENSASSLHSVQVLSVLLVITLSMLF